MTRRHLGVLALACWGIPALAANAQIVMVRNAQLRVVKELRAWSEVAEFHKHWATRKPINRTTDDERDWAFTFDIIGPKQAERWLYQANGMAAKVGGNVERVYQIKNTKALNELIGAPKY